MGVYVHKDILVSPQVGEEECAAARTQPARGGVALEYYQPSSFPLQVTEVRVRVCVTAYAFSW